MLEKLVAFCLRWPWMVMLLTLGLTGGGVYLTIERFAIDTDTAHLFSPNIPWRKNEAQLYKQFPHIDDIIVAVIDAQTPQQAEQAAAKLTGGLQGMPLIKRAWRPDEHEFFRKNGLLFLSKDDVQRTAGTLIAQQEVLQTLAEDPSLRGLTGTMLDNLKLVGKSERGMVMYTAGLDEISAAFEKVLAGGKASVDWQKMLSGGKNQEAPRPAGAPEPSPRRIVLIKPIIDYSALQPGEEAIDLVRKTAASEGLTKENGVSMRLTGQVPLADEELATVSENMALNTSITLVIITFILFAALRSPKIILAVLITLLSGLAITSGLGILVIGRFNMISVAFMALFIGLGVDFGIQFATRYRQERHGDNDLDRALLAATSGIGGSLTLAAVALLAGFFCFLPTEFRGVSELGLIAGLGMIIAYLATLTFLPAAIKLLKPRDETTPIYTASLAAVDHWIANHRKLVLAGTAAVVAAGMPYLLHLRFDSNPMNLRDQKVESVAAYLDLSNDPITAPNKIEVLAPSVEEGRELAKRIAALPEVDHVNTIDDMIPSDQDAKLPLVEMAVKQLRGVLDPKVKPAPSDAETVKALAAASKALRKAAGGPKAPPAVKRFAGLLDALAKADARTRDAARDAVFAGFEQMLGELRLAMKASRVTIGAMPDEIKSDWVSASGTSRIEVTPKGDSNDLDVMKKFAESVQTVAPNASGGPVIVSEAGKTVTKAFLQAGFFAFAAIFVILVIALRRATDVALTLGPLVLAGIMSLQAADMLGMSLNFANIIALPLMFGVGVAFHIYYVIAWRNGTVDMLASSLTRAIFFSALTTGTAFGSLFLSSHPGTASMGELLAISLFFTLLAAFIIVPAFLGPPPVNADKTKAAH